MGPLALLAADGLFLGTNISTSPEDHCDFIIITIIVTITIIIVLKSSGLKFPNCLKIIINNNVTVTLPLATNPGGEGWVGVIKEIITITIITM